MEEEEQSGGAGEDILVACRVDLYACAFLGTKYQKIKKIKGQFPRVNRGNLIAKWRTEDAFLRRR